jgi:hypothetical protein
MKLVTFSVGAQPPRVGVLGDSHIVDLTAAYEAEGRTLAGGMRQLLKEGEDALKFAATAQASGRWCVELDAAKLLAPIFDPEKIICVGMNYHDHCTEQNFPIPEVPLLFSKFASAIASPGDPIPWDTDVTQQLDFEARSRMRLHSPEPPPSSPVPTNLPPEAEHGRSPDSPCVHSLPPAGRACRGHRQGGQAYRAC